MSSAALILAAGRGSRIQESLPDKILASLAGRPAIAYSIEAFAQSGCVTTLVILYRDEPQRIALEAIVNDLNLSLNLLWVKGGTERQDSVRNGLLALPDSTDLVFIHDAARPLIGPATIQQLAQRAATTGAACLARPVTDTIKQVSPTANAFVLKTIDRSRLWAMETPQAFRRSLILAAYDQALAANRHITDDTASLEDSGHPVALVENRSPNPKLTTPGDLAFIEYLLAQKSAKTDI